MLFHFKHIGPASRSASLICLTKKTTLIGRTSTQVDYVICSTDKRMNAIVSRRHCRIKRHDTSIEIIDDSRNGVFVNDVKINVRAEVTEGDVIIMGHPNGENLAPGTRVRQPDSEYQYILEQCHCGAVPQHSVAPPAVPTLPTTLTPGGQVLPPSAANISQNASAQSTEPSRQSSQELMPPPQVPTAPRPNCTLPPQSEAMVTTRTVLASQPTPTTVAMPEPTLTTLVTSEPSLTTVATSEPTPTTVATSEPTPATVATSEPSLTIVATLEPTPTTVATSEPTQTTVVTSEPTQTTVVTSEPTPTTVTTSERTQTTVATSEPTQTTVTTSERTQTTVITSEPTPTTVTTSERTQTTVITSEPTQTTVITSEPTQTTVITSEPTQTTVITSEPTQTTVITSEPTQTTVITSEPTQTTVTTSEPTQTTVATSEPTQTTVATSEPTQTTVATSEPTQTTVATSEPTQTTVATSEPTQTTVATSEPTQTTVATSEPTQTTVATSEPTQTTVVTSEPTQTTVATSEPTQTTVATSEPTQTTVVTSEPTPITVATSEPTQTTVVTSEPTQTTVVTSEPTPITVATSEPTQTTVVTSEPTPITVATSEPTQTTVVTSEPTPITVATSEPTQTTVATSEPTPITVATSEPTQTTVATSEPTPTTVTTSEPTPTTVATSEPTQTTVATSESTPTTVASSEPTPTTVATSESTPTTVTTSESTLATVATSEPSPATVTTTVDRDLDESTVLVPVHEQRIHAHSHEDVLTISLPVVDIGSELVTKPEAAHSLTDTEQDKKQADTICVTDPKPAILSPVKLETVCIQVMNDNLPHSPTLDDKVPKIDDIAPNVDYITPQTYDIMPQADDINPRNDDITPQIDDITPQTDDIMPQTDDVTLQTDDITPQTDDVTPQTDDVTPQTDDITPQTDDVTPQTDDVTPQTDDITPQTDDITPQTDDVTPQTDDITPQTDDVTPQTDDITPQTDDITPQTDDVTLQTDDITPQTDDVTPQTDDVTPQTDDITPHTDDVTPQTDDVTPQTDDITPQTDDITPQTDDVTPQTDDITPQTDDIMPQTDDVTLQTDDSTPQTDDVTPQTDDITPQTDDITPQTDDIMPQTDDVTLQTDDSTPQTDDVTPQTDDVTPQTDDVTPQTDVITSQIDEVTLQTDDITPQTDDITPQTDDIMPQTDDITPQTDDIMPQTDDVTLQTDVITSQIDEVTLQTDDITPQTDDITPQTDDITSQTDDVTPQTDDVTPQTDDVTPQTDDVTPQTDDVTPQTDDVTPQTDDVTSQTDDVTPQTDDVTSQTDDVTPQNDDITLQTDDVMPQTDDVMPQTDDVMPQTDDVTPQTDDIMPQNDDITPQTDDIMPQTDDIMPQTDDIMPQTDDIMPQTDDIMPQTDDIIPQTDDIMPQTDNIMTQTDDITLQADDVVPQTDDITPEKGDIASQIINIQPQIEDITMPPVTIIEPQIDKVLPSVSIDTTEMADNVLTKISSGNDTQMKQVVVNEVIKESAATMTNEWEPDGVNKNCTDGIVISTEPERRLEDSVNMMFKSDQQPAYVQLSSVETEEPCTSVPQSEADEPCTSAPQSEADEPCILGPQSEADDPCTSAPQSEADEPCTSAPQSEADEACTSAPQSEAEEPCTSVPQSEADEPCTSAPQSEADEACTSAPQSEADEPCTSAPQSEADEPCTSAPQSEADEACTSAPLSEADEPCTSAPLSEADEPCTSGPSDQTGTVAHTEVVDITKTHLITAYHQVIVALVDLVNVQKSFVKILHKLIEVVPNEFDPGDASPDQRLAEVQQRLQQSEDQLDTAMDNLEDARTVDFSEEEYLDQLNNLSVQLDKTHSTDCDSWHEYVNVQKRRLEIWEQEMNIRRLASENTEADVNRISFVTMYIAELDHIADLLNQAYHKLKQTHENLLIPCLKPLETSCESMTTHIQTLSGHSSETSPKGTIQSADEPETDEASEQVDSSAQSQRQNSEASSVSATTICDNLELMGDALGKNSLQTLETGANMFDCDTSLQAGDSGQVELTGICDQHTTELTSSAEHQVEFTNISDHPHTNEQWHTKVWKQQSQTVESEVVNSDSCGRTGEFCEFSTAQTGDSESTTGQKSDVRRCTSQATESFISLEQMSEPSQRTENMSEHSKSKKSAGNTDKISNLLGNAETISTDLIAEPSGDTELASKLVNNAQNISKPLGSSECESKTSVCLGTESTTVIPSDSNLTQSAGRSTMTCNEQKCSHITDTEDKQRKKSEIMDTERETFENVPELVPEDEKVDSIRKQEEYVAKQSELIDAGELKEDTLEPEVAVEESDTTIMKDTLVCKMNKLSEKILVIVEKFELQSAEPEVIRKLQLFAVKLQTIGMELHAVPGQPEAWKQNKDSETLGMVVKKLGVVTEGLDVLDQQESDTIFEKLDLVADKLEAAVSELEDIFMEHLGEPREGKSELVQEKTNDFEDKPDAALLEVEPAIASAPLEARKTSKQVTTTVELTHISKTTRMEGSHTSPVPLQAHSSVTSPEPLSYTRMRRHSCEPPAKRLRRDFSYSAHAIGLSPGLSPGMRYGAELPISPLPGYSLVNSILSGELVQHEEQPEEHQFSDADESQSEAEAQRSSDEVMPESSDPDEHQFSDAESEGGDAIVLEKENLAESRINSPQLNHDKTRTSGKRKHSKDSKGMNRVPSLPVSVQPHSRIQLFQAVTESDLEDVDIAAPLSGTDPSTGFSSVPTEVFQDSQDSDCDSLHLYLEPTQPCAQATSHGYGSYQGYEDMTSTVYDTLGLEDSEEPMCGDDFEDAECDYESDNDENFFMTGLDASSSQDDSEQVEPKQLTSIMNMDEEELNEPSNKLTEPSNKLTEPPNELTEPPNELNEPPNELTKPPNELTDPSNELTEPSNELTKPPNELTQSLNELTEPPNELPEPPNELTEPPNELTEPPNELTEPLNELPEPPNELTDPSNELTEPPNESTEPPNELTEPPNESTEPPNELTEPPNELTDPSNELTEPSNELTKPPNELTQSLNELTEPPNELPEPPNELIEPPNELTQPLNELTDPLNELTEPPNELIEPPNELTDPLNELTEPPNELIEPPNELTQPLNELPKPLNELPKPLNELTKPQNELTEPPNELIEPPNELTQPLNELPKPLNELTQPLNELPKPLNELTKPQNELTEHSNELTEHSNELTEHSNELTEPSNELTKPPNELPKPLNELTDPLNKLTEPLNELTEYSNELTELSSELNERWMCNLCGQVLSAEDKENHYHQEGAPADLSDNSEDYFIVEEDEYESGVEELLDSQEQPYLPPSKRRKITFEDDDYSSDQYHDENLNIQDVKMVSTKLANETSCIKGLLDDGQVQNAGEGENDLQSDCDGRTGDEVSDHAHSTEPNKNLTYCQEIVNNLLESVETASFVGKSTCEIEDVDDSTNGMNTCDNTSEKDADKMTSYRNENNFSSMDYNGVKHKINSAEINSAEINSAEDFTTYPPNDKTFDGNKIVDSDNSVESPVFGTKITDVLIPNEQSSSVETMDCLSISDNNNKIKSTVLSASPDHAPAVCHQVTNSNKIMPIEAAELFRKEDETLSNLDTNQNGESSIIKAGAKNEQCFVVKNKDVAESCIAAAHVDSLKQGPEYAGVMDTDQAISNEVTFEQGFEGRISTTVSSEDDTLLSDTVGADQKEPQLETLGLEKICADESIMTEVLSTAERGNQAQSETNAESQNDKPSKHEPTLMERNEDIQKKLDEHVEPAMHSTPKRPGEKVAFISTGIDECRFRTTSQMEGTEDVDTQNVHDEQVKMSEPSDLHVRRYGEADVQSLDDPAANNSKCEVVAPPDVMSTDCESDLESNHDRAAHRMRPSGYGTDITEVDTAAGDITDMEDMATDVEATPTYESMAASSVTVMLHHTDSLETETGTTPTYGSEATTAGNNSDTLHHTDSLETETGTTPTYGSEATTAGGNSDTLHHTDSLETETGTTPTYGSESTAAGSVVDMLQRTDSLETETGATPTYGSESTVGDNTPNTLQHADNLETDVESDYQECTYSVDMNNRETIDKTSEGNGKTSLETIEINTENVQLDSQNVQTDEENIQTHAGTIQTNSEYVQTDRENVPKDVENILVDSGNEQTGVENFQLNIRNVEVDKLNQNCSRKVLDGSAIVTNTLMEPDDSSDSPADYNIIVSSQTNDHPKMLVEDYDHSQPEAIDAVHPGADCSNNAEDVTPDITPELTDPSTDVDSAVSGTDSTVDYRPMESDDEPTENKESSQEAADGEECCDESRVDTERQMEAESKQSTIRNVLVDEDLDMQLMPTQTADRSDNESQTSTVDSLHLYLQPTQTDAGVNLTSQHGPPSPSIPVDTTQDTDNADLVDVQDADSVENQDVAMLDVAASQDAPAQITISPKSCPVIPSQSCKTTSTSHQDVTCAISTQECQTAQSHVSEDVDTSQMSLGDSFHLFMEPSQVALPPTLKRLAVEDDLFSQPSEDEDTARPNIQQLLHYLEDENANVNAEKQSKNKTFVIQDENQFLRDIGWSSAPQDNTRPKPVLPLTKAVCRMPDVIDPASPIDGDTVILKSTETLGADKSVLDLNPSSQECAATWVANSADSDVDLTDVEGPHHNVSRLSALQRCDSQASDVDRVVADTEDDFVAASVEEDTMDSDASSEIISPQFIARAPTILGKRPSTEDLVTTAMVTWKDDAGNKENAVDNSMRTPQRSPPKRSLSLSKRRRQNQALSDSQNTGLSHTQAHISDVTKGGRSNLKEIGRSDLREVREVGRSVLEEVGHGDLREVGRSVLEEVGHSELREVGHSDTEDVDHEDTDCGSGPGPDAPTHYHDGGGSTAITRSASPEYSLPDDLHDDDQHNSSHDDNYDDDDDDDVEWIDKSTEANNEDDATSNEIIELSDDLDTLPDFDTFSNHDNNTSDCTISHSPRQRDEENDRSVRPRMTGDMGSGAPVLCVDSNSSHESDPDIFMTQINPPSTAALQETDTQAVPGCSQVVDKKPDVSQLLERIEARRLSRRSHNLVTPKSDPDASETVQSTSQETPGGSTADGSAVRRSLYEEEADIETADHVAKRNKMALVELGGLLRSEGKLNHHPRVAAWQSEVTKIQEKLRMPDTIIAVVGDTGSGKSSLMNALLDHADILPTSGMRACTAVVVEITNNRVNNNYEADIEFLTVEEWEAEMKLLISELTGRDGRLKPTQPDPQSDAGAAWSKIRAVYGVFQEGISPQQLMAKNKTVTRWLGKVKNVNQADPKKFRAMIDHYIESTDMGTGGDFWPIVKHVKVRIPRCKVCQSGGTLVDLPGIRDSNAARDKIAKEFLKNCTAVWVVASIHRAVDDKTAKELLGEHFRRQLLMDGQYGSVSFVCTKTDVLVPSEIRRALDLEDDVSELDEKIKKLELEQLDTQTNVEETSRSIQQLEDRIEQLEVEVAEAQDITGQITEALTQYPSEDEDEDQVSLATQRDDQQRQITEDVQEIAESREQIKELRRNRRKLKQKCVELVADVEVTRKQITAICAKARSEYSKNQIRRDFRAGLKEMKRQAGLLEEEDEAEEEEDDDDDDIMSTVDNLNVFCVSALEYLKLKKKLPKEDGEAQVFSRTEDTGIPTLQSFVDTLTKQRRVEGSQRLTRCIGQMLVDLHGYLMDEGTKDRSMRGSTKSIFVELLNKLRNERVAGIIDRSSERIDALFTTSLRPKAQEGASNAASAAPDVAAKWGSKVNKENRKEGGYCWSTYKATVNRDGVYKSATAGPIDFNEDLSGPMYASITIVWDRVFNSYLNNILDSAKNLLLEALMSFGVEMRQQLTFLGVNADRVERVRQQQLTSARNKLTETIMILREFISERQRDTSRIITPHVQSRMLRVYQRVNQDRGPGVFNRMKADIGAHVQHQRAAMFDSASQQLLEQLLQLQTEVISRLQEVFDGVLKDLTALYEPLWEAPDTALVLKQTYLPGVKKLCRDVQVQYNTLHLEDCTEYAALDIACHTPVILDPRLPCSSVCPTGPAPGAPTPPTAYTHTARIPGSRVRQASATGAHGRPLCTELPAPPLKKVKLEQKPAELVTAVKKEIGTKNIRKSATSTATSLNSLNCTENVSSSMITVKGSPVDVETAARQISEKITSVPSLDRSVLLPVTNQGLSLNTPVRLPPGVSISQYLRTIQAGGARVSSVVNIGSGSVNQYLNTGAVSAGDLPQTASNRLVHAVPSTTVASSISSSLQFSVTQAVSRAVSRAVPRVVSRAVQQPINQVKSEPTSPGKRKKPKDYGTINLISDSSQSTTDSDSDIPTLKKRKKR